MKQKLFAVFTLVFLILPSGILAKGTPAGTSITNSATVDYNIGATEYRNIPSNTTETIVAEILDVTIVSQNNTSLPVSPDTESEMLTFLVKNTGNGRDSYSLDWDSISTDGDDFLPVHRSVYYDSNLNGSYDSGDSVYTGVETPLTLNAEQEIRVFLFNDIPANNIGGSPLANTAEGVSELTIASRSFLGSLPPGSVADSDGDTTIAIIGSTGATASASGAYVISTIVISIVKSLEVSNDFGTTIPLPGATIKYTLEISATGSGSISGAEKVIVSDNIPGYTSYKENTIFLDDTTQLNDTECTTGEDVSAIRVPLGTMNAGDTHKITFEVEID